MIKKIIIILIGFSASFLNAQTNLDSLFSIWSDDSKPDTIRFNAMDIYIEEGYANKRPDSAFYFAQLLLDMAQEKGNKLWQANALIALGNSVTLKGDLQQASDYMNQALTIYEEMTDKMGIAKAKMHIANLYTFQGMPDEAIQFALESARLNEELKNEGELAKCYNILGNAYSEKGNYFQALEFLNQGRRLAAKNGNLIGEMSALNSIGIIYMIQKENELALKCYFQVLEGCEKLNDKRGTAAALSNIGSIYGEINDLEKSLDFFERSLKIAEEQNLKRGVVVLQNNIGMIYFMQGYYENALKYQMKSLKGAEEIGSKSQIGEALSGIATSYKALNNNIKARQYAEDALSIAQEANYLSLIQMVSAFLSDLYKDEGNYKRSFEMYEQSIMLRDSLKNEENQKAIIQQNFVFEYEKKSLADSLKAEEAKLIVQYEHQQEVLKREKQRDILLGSGVLILFIATGLWSRLQYTRKAKKIIENEKDRSEELLLNILPYEVAEELKEKGHAEAQLIDNVTVLFTDFKGFTAMAEKVSPKELVNDLNICFSEFDHIMGKYNIEKIKTIGDAYMAAGGLPTPNDTHSNDVIKAAFEMVKFVEEGKARKIKSGLPYFEIRVGVHTGPVVAGIVGVKKFQYDIWGDTVNTASRMESNGEVGKVNLSQTTYDLLKANTDYKFENRGKIEAKGKGDLDMYFVSLNLPEETTEETRSI